MLVVGRAAGPATLVVPLLERPAAEAGSRVDIPIATWTETAGPGGGRRPTRPGAWPPRRPAIGVSDRLWSLHLLRLQAALPAASFASATTALRTLRMTKDDDEVTLLRLAAEAADRVVDQIAAGPLVGRTEADVARRGPRAAPRGGPRPRRVRDRRVGAQLGVAAPRGVGPGDPGRRADRPRHRRDAGRLRQRHHPDAVGDRRRRRERPGRRVPPPVRRAPGRPGTRDERRPARESRARRSTPPPATSIAAEGYGEAFIHRTGHGIGLEGHEEPYLVAGNGESLGEGMAFSVEPGIYLDGRYGARIEDIVVCGPDGPVPLNTTDRDLRVVPG